MAFATVADVATYLQRDLDASDAATAEMVLDIATEMIRSYTGQRLDSVANETVTLPATSTAELLLPSFPVTAVSSVVHDGKTLVVDDDYVWTRAGVVTKTMGYWTARTTITYSHGYSPIPADVRGVCIEVTKRAMENPAGLQRDDLNTASQWLGFTRENRAVLDRYKG